MIVIRCIVIFSQTSAYTRKSVKLKRLIKSSRKYRGEKRRDTHLKEMKEINVCAFFIIFFRLNGTTENVYIVIIIWSAYVEPAYSVLFHFAS